MTPHHEMNLNSLDLRDLKTTHALTRDRKEQKKFTRELSLSKTS